MDRTSTSKSLPLGIALAVALGLGAVPFAHAQSFEPRLAQAQPPMGTETVTEEDLKAYASAALEVQEIRNKWQPQISQAENAEKVEKMRNQALDEMVQAIEAQGLTVQEYNQINSLAQTNPQVRQTILDHMQQNAR